MRHKNERWMSGWPTVREKGMFRFVLLHGVLTFGSIFGAIWFVLNRYAFGKSFEPIKFALSIVIAGLVFGTLEWYRRERKIRLSGQSDT